MNEWRYFQRNLCLTVQLRLGEAVPVDRCLLSPVLFRYITPLTIPKYV